MQSFIRLEGRGYSYQFPRLKILLTGCFEQSNVSNTSQNWGDATRQWRPSSGERRMVDKRQNNKNDGDWVRNQNLWCAARNNQGLTPQLLFAMKFSVLPSFILYAKLLTLYLVMSSVSNNSQSFRNKEIRPFIAMMYPSIFIRCQELKNPAVVLANIVRWHLVIW